MKIIDSLKTIWREILAIDEAKISFFHNSTKLSNSKEWHRLFRSFRNEGEIIFYDSEREVVYLKTQDSLILATDIYYSILAEVFKSKAYSLPPQISEKDFIVFDVGMNRGYASLFFANMNHCKHVYGFEIDEKTYQFAEENFRLNAKLANKITASNFGFWNENTKLEIGSYGKDDDTFIKGTLAASQNTIFKKSHVKKSSEVTMTIFNKIDDNILKVLKIDVEGSEYVIFEDLYKNNVIQQFDLIIGEYHNGLDELTKYLGDFNCIYKDNSAKKAQGTIVYINKQVEYGIPELP